LLLIFFICQALDIWDCPWRFLRNIKCHSCPCTTHLASVSFSNSKYRRGKKGVESDHHGNMKGREKELWPIRKKDADWLVISVNIGCNLSKFHSKQMKAVLVINSTFHSGPLWQPCMMIMLFIDAISYIPSFQSNLLCYGQCQQDVKPCMKPLSSLVL